ncbi:MAG: hypothetical protein J0L84_18580 [Verrucomicrobia bacterium]|nr:hypothetical protein [Verrucomicrobiota bacterium]
MSHKFDAALDAVLDTDSRYARAAYHFLRDVLESLQSPVGRRRRQGVHVATSDFLDHLRIGAIGQFGPMAGTVLEDWGIRSCDDFGEMMFLLMAHGIVERGSADRREDFSPGFDFAEAFSRPFAPGAESRGGPRWTAGAKRVVTDAPEPVR